MSNLIHASQCGTAEARTEETTFVEGHLGRIPLFLLMLHIGRRVSGSRGSHMKRLIATSRERVSNYLSVRIHVTVLTNTGTSQNKHAL